MKRSFASFVGTLSHAFSARLVAVAACGVLLLAVTLAVTAEAQVTVVEPLPPVPMAAGFPGGYVANYSYSPAGNYAAVTAFSPPVALPYVSGYAVSAPAVSVTSFYAPTVVAGYAPVVAGYAPVVAGYAPVERPAVPAYAPVVAAPVTTYYAPAAVAVPLYRRGLFGGLRPARSAMYIPY
jgi:hypothetical protein